MIAAQVALYPLGTTDPGEAIKEALAALDDGLSPGVSYEVGEMSTVLRGDDDAVWRAVRRLFEAGAAGGGQVVLVTTVSNVCGC